MDTFWRTQEKSKPLFPDIEWNKPERRDQAGKLAIIGGNKLGFAAVADSYQTALVTGVGEVRVLLPDALRCTVPSAMADVLFAPTNPSGSLSSEAANNVQAIANWADVTLLIGDAGRNSQTAILYEQLLKTAANPVVITRDAIDLVQNSFHEILDNPHLTFVASFAQTQKIFRSVYYPKILTFSMQLAQFVEALHKFSVTYPVTLCAFHADHLVLARGGEVITQAWHEPMAIWNGAVPSRIASYVVWSPEAPLAAAATAIATS